ncbi:MAG: rhamnulokinase [Clostridia bacterium]|nr:rhamnulokinase [Clostridia bacterium]
MKRVLAFDFGASSGRAIIGKYENGIVSLEEVHRFSNDPVTVNGVMYWDVLRLFHEIKQGILKAKNAGGFDSIGIDTWGVDFGLIDSNGNLLGNPVHYRDRRNSGMIAIAEKLMPKREIYEKTGIQFLEFNTLYQLLSLKENDPETLRRADKILFMPDLFSYFLTGNAVSEYSVATTSQMIDVNSGKWDKDLLEMVGISEEKFAPIVKSGTVVGMLRDEICEELGLKSVPVIAVCGHDTQSAISAVPKAQGDIAFISCGTWSIFGTELSKPVVNDTTYEMSVTNEGGFGDAIGFVKNIAGLWLIQESRRQWKKEGSDYSFADLEKAALESESFRCFIDPDDPIFASPGNMPQRVKDYCKKTGQPVPETVGEIMRCMYESLAMKYRLVFEKIKKCVAKDYDTINMIGGGTKDTLLCKMTAGACNTKVVAGPVEATALGNVCVQLIACGELDGISQARETIAQCETLKTYEPADADKWEKAFERFKAIVK